MGTPTGTQAAVEYTYTVTDADGDTDTETLRHHRHAGQPTLVRQAAPSPTESTSRTSPRPPRRYPRRPAADAPLTYSLSPPLPTGMSFNATSRELSGTPSVTKAQTTYTYTVTDKDNDTATLTFKLTVEADTEPLLSGTISDQSYHQNSADQHADAARRDRRQRTADLQFGAHFRLAVAASGPELRRRDAATDRHPDRGRSRRSSTPTPSPTRTATPIPRPSTSPSPRTTHHRSAAAPLPTAFTSRTSPRPPRRFPRRTAATRR